MVLDFKQIWFASNPRGRSCDNSAQFAPFFDLFTSFRSLLASGAVIFIGTEKSFLAFPVPSFLRWIFFRFLLSSLLILYGPDARFPDIAHYMPGCAHIGP